MKLNIVAHTHTQTLRATSRICCAILCCTSGLQVERSNRRQSQTHRFTMTQSMTMIHSITRMQWNGCSASVLLRSESHAASLPWASKSNKRRSLPAWQRLDLTFLRHAMTWNDKQNILYPKWSWSWHIYGVCSVTFLRTKPSPQTSGR